MNNNIPLDIRREIGNFITKYGIKECSTIQYLPYHQYFLVLMVKKYVFVSLTKECKTLTALGKIFSITDCEQILSDLKEKYE